MLSANTCRAVIHHLVAADLAANRGSRANSVIADLNQNSDLDNGPVAADSLEILGLARVVTEFFQLEKSGQEEWLLRRRNLNTWQEVVSAALSANAMDGIRFRTGGTTGEPRVCTHLLSDLATEASHLALLVPDVKRVVSLVPLHHIYGFMWGALLADQLQLPLLHGEEALQAVHSGLQEKDLLLTVPEWSRYLASIETRFPGELTAVTSTAPCPPALGDQLRAKGLGRLIEVYGSSETGGIGWRDCFDQPFQLFSHWSRVGDGQLRSSATRCVDLPDHVTWHDEDRLLPLKRRDHAIQIGGVNVWPERVQAFIASHPLVQDCAVRTMETASGTRLKAFLVAADNDTENLEAELRSWLSDRLPAVERPINLTVGEQLPRNNMGKLCDW